MESNRYTAVIVGAGPAGSAAALKLAQKDVSVALLERGKKPGSKNMFGGSIYGKLTAEIVPNFWEEAPVERKIVTDELWFMNNDSAVKLGFSGLEFKTEPPNKFSVIRSKFDPWLAQQAVDKGAKLLTNTLVTDLVYENTGLLNDKVVGVKLDSGEIIRCDVVLLAEGAAAPLTEQAGLRDEISSSHLKLYVKEELALPAEKIEERFNLKPDEGANLGFIGYPTSGAIGKAGIWTNKNSLSLVVGAYLNQLVSKGLEPYQLLQHTKSHPLISRLLENAEPISYKAHTIPKGGWKKIPQLYDDGLLVAGDAAMLVSARRGTDLAMFSGSYAAETIAQAQAAQDFSKQLLQGYEQRLKNSFIFEELKSKQSTNQYYQQHQDADYLMANTITKAAYNLFTIDQEPSQKKMKEITGEISTMQPLTKTIIDLYQGAQHWRVL